MSGVLIGRHLQRQSYDLHRCKTVIVLLDVLIKLESRISISQDVLFADNNGTVKDPPDLQFTGSYIKADVAAGGDSICREHKPVYHFSSSFACCPEVLKRGLCKSRFERPCPLRDELVNSSTNI